MQHVKIIKVYPDVNVGTVIGQPVYDKICELAALNGHSLDQALRILICIRMEQLLKDGDYGTDSADS